MADRIAVRRRVRAGVWAVAAGVILVQIVMMLGIHVLSLALGQNGFYPIVLGGDDGKFHYAVARYMLATNHIGISVDFADITIWPAVIAEFMKLTGTQSILPIKQILVFGRLVDIAAAMIVLEALRKQRPEWETPRAAFWSRVAVLCLVGLYPSAIFYSFGSLYRDALIYGFYFLAVAFLAQAVADRRPGARVAFLMLTVPTLYVLFEFRAYAAYSVVVGLLLWALGPAVRRLTILVSHRPLVRDRLTWSLVAILCFAAGCGAWYTRPIQLLIAFRDTYFLTPGGGNLGISFTGKNPVAAAPLYAYSWVSNLMGPLPWQVRAASHAIDFVLEVPLFTYVLWAIWRRRAGLTPTCRLLIAQAVAWTSLIAFTNDNLGTASRLRVLGWQCLFVVFAYLLPRVAPPLARWRTSRIARLPTPDPA